MKKKQEEDEKQTHVAWWIGEASKKEAVSWWIREATKEECVLMEKAGGGKQKQTLVNTVQLLVKKSFDKKSETRDPRFLKRHSAWTPIC